MSKALSRRLTVYVAAACLLGVTSLQPVIAAMISTETALATEQRSHQVARIQDLLQRNDVKQQLVALGVSPTDAASRVAGMTDVELAQINGQIDQLPAGGSALAVIGIVFVVLLILEIVGVTDIFKKI